MVIGIIRKTDKDENIIWEIYVDGEDDSIPPLIQEGAAKNCGVYCSYYMMIIGLASDIDALVETFENKSYYTLFVDINPDTVLFKRKLLSVMIADANEFMKL